VAELADLDILGSFKHLTHLSLLENPVTGKEVRAFFSIIAQCFVCSFGYLGKVRGEANVFIALPILGPMALSLGPLPRLQKGEGCRAQEG